MNAIDQKYIDLFNKEHKADFLKQHKDNVSSGVDEIEETLWEWLYETMPNETDISDETFEAILKGIRSRKLEEVE